MSICCERIVNFFCSALLYDESIHHVEGNFDSLKELYLEPANATSKLLAQYVAGNAAENTYGNSILKYSCN